MTNCFEKKEEGCEAGKREEAKGRRWIILLFEDFLILIISFTCFTVSFKEEDDVEEGGVENEEDESELQSIIILSCCSGREEEGNETGKID